MIFGSLQNFGSEKKQGQEVWVKEKFLVEVLGCGIILGRHAVILDQRKILDQRF